MQYLNGKMVTNKEYQQYQIRKNEWIRGIANESKSERYDEKKRAWIRGLARTFRTTKSPQPDIDIVEKLKTWGVQEWAKAYKLGYAEYAKEVLSADRNAEQLLDAISKVRGT